VYEPRKLGGALNPNAVFAAAAVLAGARDGVKATPEERRRAAERLVQLYREGLEVEPLESLVEIARG
jgi:hypothetical protein